MTVTSKSFRPSIPAMSYEALRRACRFFFGAVRTNSYNLRPKRRGIDPILIK